MEIKLVILGGGWQTIRGNNLRGIRPGGNFACAPDTPRPAKGFRTFRNVRQEYRQDTKP